MTTHLNTSEHTAIFGPAIPASALAKKLIRPINGAKRCLMKMQQFSRMFLGVNAGQHPLDWSGLECEVVPLQHITSACVVFPTLPARQSIGFLRCNHFDQPLKSLKSVRQLLSNVNQHTVVVYGA